MLKILVLIFCILTTVTDLHAGPAETVNTECLSVCADPNAMPQSNQKGEGYENKIAELFARELGLPLYYDWFPQNINFIRDTLKARKCDLIIGVSETNEMLQTTIPYYRSTHVLVYRKNSKLDISTLADPKLKELRNIIIGVTTNSPAALLLQDFGLFDRMSSYNAIVDQRLFDAPGKSIIDDVASGKLTMGIVWGPTAAYQAKRAATHLKIVPLHSKLEKTELDFAIAMGIRRGEPMWKNKIEGLIKKLQPQISKILREYDVPLVDEKGNLIPGPTH